MVSIVIFSLCVLIYYSIRDGGVLALALIDILLFISYPSIILANDEADDWILTPASVSVEEAENSSLEWLNLLEVFFYSVIYLLIISVLLLFVIALIYVYFL